MIALASLSAPMMAQTADTPIESMRFQVNDQALISKLTALREKDQLISGKAIVEMLKKPVAEKIDLPQASVTPLATGQIASRARESLVRIGWFYLCHNCNNWHVNVADGYAIAPGGIVATCHHCVAPNDTSMREGYLFAMDSKNNVYPVRQIIAADARMDAAIVKLENAEITPLALQDENELGAQVYLLSDPNQYSGYFSTGIINRFYWRPDASGTDRNDIKSVRSLRVNVSTDWSPGSSGAPVLDACGNIIGHVSTISTVDRRPDQQQPISAPYQRESAPAGTQPRRNAMPPQSGSTFMILHEAVPARGVKLLAQYANTQAANDHGNTTTTHMP